LYQEKVLGNGLRLITNTMPHARSVSICFFIGVGSRYESEAEAGISHFIEHLCFKGTPKRPTARDISAAIEGVGGIVNGGTDKELTLYWCKVARPHFHLVLDVLADILLNASFDSVEMEHERQVICEEISMGKDLPSQRASLLIDELLWPGHPLGRDVAGSRESVTAVTRDMIVDFHNSRYLPGNVVVAIAGNIRHEEAVAAVNRVVAGWAGRKPRPGYVAYKEQPNPRLRVERKETEQAHLCLGVPGLSFFHPGRYTLDLLNVILGEGMSSRLFTEIRDRLGLAYSIHSYVDRFLDSGALTVYAGVEPKNLPTAVEAILEQLAGLKEAIPEAEIVKAKELAKGRLLLRMEDTRNVATWAGGQKILTGQILSVDEVVSIVDAITARDLKEMAQKVLVGKDLRLAVVGPVAGDEPLAGLLKL